MAIVISDLGNILADIFAKSKPDRKLLEVSENYDEASSDFTGAILEFCDRSSAEDKVTLRQSVEMKLQLLKAA